MPKHVQYISYTFLDMFSSTINTFEYICEQYLNIVVSLLKIREKHIQFIVTQRSTIDPNERILLFFGELLCTHVTTRVIESNSNVSSSYLWAPLKCPSIMFFDSRPPKRLTPRIKIISNTLIHEITYLRHYQSTVSPNNKNTGKKWNRENKYYFFSKTL